MTDSGPFDVVGTDAIREGRATDAYFERTVEALEHAGKNPHVVAEVTADQFPTGECEVLAGLKDLAQLFEGYDVDVDALPEGQLFDGGPVARIEGDYLEFCRLETALLGFLSHASGIATAALETRMAAPDSVVLSFGSRHVHPSLGAMVERAALVAGLDGISNVAAGEVIGRDAGGTMPHALVLCFGRGNQEAAWRAFDEGVDAAVPRVALCDTFGDEVEEVIRALETIDDIDSVRLDTTRSRRGDFRHIVREVRWELDARGHEDVDIFVSGGLGPEQSAATSATPTRSTSRWTSSKSTARPSPNAGSSRASKTSIGRPTAATTSGWPTSQDRSTGSRSWSRSSETAKSSGSSTSTQPPVEHVRTPIWSSSRAKSRTAVSPWQVHGGVER